MLRTPRRWLTPTELTRLATDAAVGKPVEWSDEEEEIEEEPAQQGQGVYEM